MSTSETLSRPLVLKPVTSVKNPSRIRHIDQLDDEAQQQFYDVLASRSQSLTSTADGTFIDGEIIVFTDYYRVERR